MHDITCCDPRCRPCHAIMATLAAAGLESGSAPIPLLRIGEILPVPSLDETKSFYASEVTQFGLETLLQFGPQGQLEPDLATSVIRRPIQQVHLYRTQFLRAERGVRAERQAGRIARLCRGSRTGT
jgi:hypothetical protein